MPYYRNERDPRENEETSPPPDEEIEVHAVWVAEVYPPSLIGSLLEGARRLGWDKDDFSAFRPFDNVLRWIGDSRGSPFGGAWLNLGMIDRPRAERRYLPEPRLAPLPDGVDYAMGGIHGITSGLTVLVLGFVFEDSPAQKLNDPLTQKYETFYRRTSRTSWSFSTPRHQKQDAVKQARDSLTELSTSWIRENIPGAFSSGLLDGEFPSVELLTTRVAEPFQPVDQPDLGYEFILNIDGDFDAYENPALPGVRLGRRGRIPEESPFARVLAGRWEEVLAGKDLHSYGGKTRAGVVHYLRETVESNLVLWALQALLIGYQRQLAQTRDQTRDWTPLPPRTAARELARAREQIARNGRDAETAASEIKELATVVDGKAFLRYGADFRPVDGVRRKHYGESLLGPLRESCVELAERLERTESQVRSSLRADAEIVASATNVRLQRTVVALTVVLVILTVALLGLTVVLLQDTGADEGDADASAVHQEWQENGNPAPGA